MESNDSNKVENATKAPNATHIVTAEAVQAEEVPTIPLSSLQTLSTMKPEVSVRSVASTRTVSIPTPLVVQPSEYRRSLSEWLQVYWDSARPAYLPLSLLPVLVGSVVAWTQTITPKAHLGHYHLTHFIAAIIVVVMLQMGANYVNDYYDYLRGVDTGNVYGPGGLIQQGLVSPARILTIGLALLGAGSLIGLVIAAAGGPLLYLLGLAGVLCAFFYSATTRSLSSMALGEVVCFCVFGPLLTLGAYLLQTSHVDRTALLYSLPLGLIATAAVHANNMRDAEGDAHVGKRTIASLIGLEWSRVLYVVLLLGAYAIIAALGIPRGSNHLILIALWTFPLLVVAISGVLRTDAPGGLHLVMRQTLKLEIWFATLLIVALIVAAFLPLLPPLPALPTHLWPF